MDELSQLLTSLQSAEPKERDKAALYLRDVAEAAVPALLRAIHDPANKNHRGTLVWVLEVFNCSEHFAPLFSLAITGNYEVQSHALSILQKQSFAPTTQETQTAEKQLNEFEQRQHPPSGTALLCSELREVISRFHHHQSQPPHGNAQSNAPTDG